MWSGPRNLSTALMRSWGSRADTFVTDEPLDAHYLKATGAAHPGRDEVIAAHETDWRRVVAWITGPVPGGRAIWYQKHMTHHLLDGIDRGWVASMVNAFLIRDPGEVLASLARVTPHPGLEDTGLPRQVELFERERERTGRTPPVIDAADLLRDPRGMLSRLCDAVGVPFDEAMLSWAPGRRETDGAWARHWYASVERSTGFEPYTPRRDPVPERLSALLGECREYYGVMHRERLRA
jgi:hypothetical protein